MKFSTLIALVGFSQAAKSRSRSQTGSLNNQGSLNQALGSAVNQGTLSQLLGSQGSQGSNIPVGSDGNQGTQSPINYPEFDHDSLFVAHSRHTYELMDDLLDLARASTTGDISVADAISYCASQIRDSHKQAWFDYGLQNHTDQDGNGRLSIPELEFSSQYIHGVMIDNIGTYVSDFLTTDPDAPANSLEAMYAFEIEPTNDVTVDEAVERVVNYYVNNFYGSDVSPAEIANLRQVTAFGMDKLAEGSGVIDYNAWRTGIDFYRAMLRSDSLEIVCPSGRAGRQCREDNRNERQLANQLERQARREANQAQRQATREANQAQRQANRAAEREARRATRQANRQSGTQGSSTGTGTVNADGSLF